MTKNVPFYGHDLGKPELDALAEVFAGPVLTTGDMVEAFEARFSQYLGVRHVLATSSCTGALHMALLALGIGPGDQVITTPMTFVATACAIVEAGATPVFVDVEPESGNLDANRVEDAVTPATKAIVPVHLYGQMCDMAALAAIAGRRGLALVEDSAHCVEGRRDGIGPGGSSDAAAFSFYATKNLTCGEGGALATNDTGLYERLKPLRLHGITHDGAHRERHGYQPYDMPVFGWKYNMSNIEAAILLPQFDRIDRKLAAREELARTYERDLAVIPGVTTPRTLPHTLHARHLFPVRIETADRDRVLAGLHERGVRAVVNYPPVHLMSHFRRTLGHGPGDFPAAERIGATTLSLPLYPSMPRGDVRKVVEALADIMEEA